MLLSWILNSVSKDIAASIIFIESAEDMWIDLRDRLSQRNRPRFFQKISLSQGDSSISSYYTQMKGLLEELMKFIEVFQIVLVGLLVLLRRWFLITNMKSMLFKWD